MYEAIQILGIRFFDGTVNEAVAQASRGGGYVVVPAAPALVKLRYDAHFRAALTGADLAIPDSGLMVLLWKFLRGEGLNRISGLTYLKRLLREPAVREPGRIFFVLPSDTAKTKLMAWSHDQAFPFDEANCYVAPRYGAEVSDERLRDKIDNLRPAHVVIAIGSGPQEKLGRYLRDNLSYRPAIHCIGAALGFLTGDQIAIPDWADRFYLGWLLRLFAQPRIFIPRLGRALALPWLLLRYGEEMPPLRSKERSEI